MSTSYRYLVYQVYDTPAASAGGATLTDLPTFTEPGPAVRYLDAAPFPGFVLRHAIGPDGEVSWIGQAHVYTKYEGITDYHAARAAMGPPGYGDLPLFQQGGPHA